MKTAYFLFSEFEDYMDYSDSLSEDNNKIKLKEDAPQYKKLVDGIQKKLRSMTVNMDI